MRNRRCYPSRVNEDFYSILGVAPTATAAEIKDRFRFLSHAFHPDKFATAAQRETAERDFKRINEAYQVLYDPAQRARYDASRSQSSTHQTPPRPHTPPPEPPAGKATRRWSGLRRLAFFLFLLFWPSIAVIAVNDAQKTGDNYILSQVCEYYGFAPKMPSEWITTLAKDVFLSLPAEERRSMAARYFDEHIAGVARESYYDAHALRQWFIRSATLTLEEAPIREINPFADSPTYTVRYRNAPTDYLVQMPRVLIWDTLFTRGVVFAALGAALVATLAIGLCVSVIRGIAKGFTRNSKQ